MTTGRRYDPAAALAAARAATGGQRPPHYGTPAWAALPDGHPGKHAAVLLAAECWHRYWHPDMRALRADAAERDLRARLRAMSADLADARDWSRHATAPSYAELECRRATATVTCAERGCPRPVDVPDDYDSARWIRLGRARPRCRHHADATQEAA